MKYIKLFLINILAIGIVHYFCFWIADVKDDVIYKSDSYNIALITPIVLFIVNYLLEKKKGNITYSSLIFVLVGSIGGMFLHFALSHTPFQNGFPYDPHEENISNALVLFLYKAVFIQCLIGSVFYGWALHKIKSSSFK